VAGQLVSILQGGNLGTEQEAFDQFYEAFLGIIFSDSLVSEQKSVVSISLRCSSASLCLPPQHGVMRHRIPIL
jgi:hypothetical protein